jgi:hypothetical protein
MIIAYANPVSPHRIKTYARTLVVADLRQRAPMQTYMTHAWMIADAADQRMGTLVISTAGAIEIR